MRSNNSDNEPNPPVWSDTVLFLRPTDDMHTIQQRLQQVHDPKIDMSHFCAGKYNDNNKGSNNNNCPIYDNNYTSAYHFHPQRRVVLFVTPGQYCNDNLLFQVGYYTQVLGLGRHVNDVQFVYRKNDNEKNDSNKSNIPIATGSNNNRNSPGVFVGPFVSALNKHLHINKDGVPIGTSLDTFWRSAENLTVTCDGNEDKKDQDGVSMMWATSQASSLRRINVARGSLYLHDGCAYASGGHVCNSYIHNTLHLGSQQQYCIRNVHVGKESTPVGGAWSMVYIGCTGNVPCDDNQNYKCTGLVNTVISKPRVRIEKPYIVMKENEQFELVVPTAKYADHPNYTTDPILGRSDDDIVRDFTNIRVIGEIDAADDDAVIYRIQEALDEGKDVVLCPGIYKLKQSLVFRHPNQVLLGLGLATLVAPTDGSPCITVTHNTPGVRLAGLMLEATELDDTAKETSSLVIWGEANHTDKCTEVVDDENRNNPGAMWDIYIRVGGATTKTTNGAAAAAAATTTTGNNPACIDRTMIAVHTMMIIHSNYVIGDNLWLWRADHAELHQGEICNYPAISPIYWQTESSEYCAKHGLYVSGDDVTIFGLAVEHANYHQTIWSGERGAVYFYQSELPYDTTHKDVRIIPSADGKTTTNDMCGYQIQSHVREHDLYGPGIYSNFRNTDIYASTAIEHPQVSNIHVINPFIVKLDNLGGIQSIVNTEGPGTHKQGKPVRFVNYRQKEYLKTYNESMTT